MLHILKKAGYESLEAKLREQIQAGNMTRTAAYVIARQVLDTSTIKPTDPASCPPNKVIIGLYDHGGIERLDDNSHLHVEYRDFTTEEEPDGVFVCEEDGESFTWSEL